MIGRKLLDIMEHDGVPISDSEREKVTRDLDSAVKDGRIRFIVRDGKTIGFITYVENWKDNTLINYAFIYKKFRNKCNFVTLRKVFREAFRSRFIWKSRRRKRVCNVR